MKSSLFNYGRLFWITPLILNCLLFTTKSYSEEANLKINIFNLDKPGVLYLRMRQDLKEQLKMNLKKNHA